MSAAASRSAAQLPGPPVIALFGPTAVGKTAVAVALARRLRALGQRPIAVSADAMQVYRGLEQLTGAADALAQAELEHRLLAFLDLQESFSAGRYARLAHAEIDAIIAAGGVAIVVGGTGLYLRAALCDLDLRPPPAPGVRERWMQELARRGAHALHELLASRAPEAAAAIAPTDSHRIVRALELHEAGQLRPPPAQSQLWTAQTRRPTLLVALELERTTLYRRIDERVERIVASGAAAEVQRALAAGASVTARRALGFAELAVGDVEGLKRNTRRYARRQLTWMRKLTAVQRLRLDGLSAEEAAETIVGMWQQAGRRAPP
jgi:tRNA dimethylallyltransferase